MPLRAGFLRLSVFGIVAIAGLDGARANEPLPAPTRSFATILLRQSLLPEPEPAPDQRIAIRPAAAEPEPSPIRPAAEPEPPAHASESPSTQVAEPLRGVVAAALEARSTQTSTDAGHAPSVLAPRALPAPAQEPSWPRTLVEVRRAKEAPRPALWSKSEIEEARKACVGLLKGLDVVALPVEPFRDGECGSPAAVQLVSLGRSPEVTFSPPPVLTCEMVAGLGKWLGEIQPSARRHLGAPLIRIDVMSSYSCRNAYGRRDARLSEHGRANAIDIAAFLTSVGYETAVLDHWGPTQRMARRTAPPLAPLAPATATIVAAPRVAPAPTNLATAQSIVRLPPAPAPAITPAFIANRPVAAPPPVAGPRTAPLPPVQVQAPPPSPVVAQTTPVPPPAPAAAAATSVIATGVRALTGNDDTFRNADGVTFAPMSRLGGPRPLLPADVPADAKAKFLRDIHVSACRIFGTVLGPEANRAHENHFHVDMADRRTGSFCE